MIIVVKNIPYLADALRAHDEVLSLPYEQITNEVLRETQAHSLFIRTTTRVNSALVEGTALRFIGSATSGVDHVDSVMLEERGIALASAAGSNANAVAEWVLYAMLSRAKERGTDLRRQTLGVVGFGHIGKLIAAYAEHLGLRVLVNDPPLQSSGMRLPAVIDAYADLSTLLRESDIITNHVPLTSNSDHATRLLFNAGSLALTKADVHFVHSSRGGIVDEDALMLLLKRPGADLSIDVWQDEPNYSLELARAARVATPHVSGHSTDGIIEAADMLLRAYMAWSGRQYDADIITSHRSTSLMSIDDYVDTERLRADLQERLQVERYHNALCHPPEGGALALGAYFLEQRFSYTGRRELLRRPNFL